MSSDMWEKNWGRYFPKVYRRGLEIRKLGLGKPRNLSISMGKSRLAVKNSFTPEKLNFGQITRPRVGGLPLLKMNDRRSKGQEGGRLGR